MDVQLLGQLCDLGLEMAALREELVTVLEEEDDDEEEEEESCVEEEHTGSWGKQEEGCSAAPNPAQRPPDFEMTI